MSEKYFRGTGMMIDEFGKIEVNDFDALRKENDEYSRYDKYGHAEWERFAAFFEEVLDRAGLKLVGIEGVEYEDEDFAGWRSVQPHDLEYIAREYLVQYHYFAKQRDERFSNFSHTPEFFFLLEHVFKMGELVERQYWRAGIDPISGDTREENALRGRTTLLSSKAGGAVRKGQCSESTKQVLSMMEPLIEKLRSVSAAADIVARKGIGSSKEANRALWYNHRKKL